LSIPSRIIVVSLGDAESDACLSIPSRIIVVSLGDAESDACLSIPSRIIVKSLGAVGFWPRLLLPLQSAAGVRLHVRRYVLAGRLWQAGTCLLSRDSTCNQWMQLSVFQCEMLNWRSRVAHYRRWWCLFVTYKVCRVFLFNFVFDSPGRYFNFRCHSWCRVAQ
jgi:hypothetical protein